MMHGQGTYNYQNGDYFRGTFEHGSKRDGIMRYMDGSEYAGEFKNDQKTGYAML